jgi:hypothetical protein
MRARLTTALERMASPSLAQRQKVTFPSKRSRSREGSWSFTSAHYSFGHLGRHQQIRISQFKIPPPQKYKLPVTADVCYTSSRSMRTCMNILTSIWPVTPVAQATRRERSFGGSMLSQGLSSGLKHYPNLDRPMVGR